MEVDETTGAVSARPVYEDKDDTDNVTPQERQNAREELDRFNTHVEERKAVVELFMKAARETTHKGYTESLSRQGVTRAWVEAHVFFSDKGLPLSQRPGGSGDPGILGGVLSSALGVKTRPGPWHALF